MARKEQRLLDRLYRLLGLSRREAPASLPPMEALESRTLMSIALLGPVLPVNSEETFSNVLPRVATADNGNYVVVWTTSSVGQLHFRLFDSTGTPLTDDMLTTSFLGGTPSAGGTAHPQVFRLNQSQFDVAMDADGDFVIAWQDSSDILAQRFNSSGNAAGEVINITESGTELTNETAPSIAMDDDGDFAVAWLLDTQVDVNVKVMSPKTYYEYVDPETATVKRITNNATSEVSPVSYITSIVQARRFSASGTGGEVITVSADAVAGGTSQTLTFATNLNPSIAMDSDGDFAVAWNQVNYAPVKTPGAPSEKTTNTYEGYDLNNNPKTFTLHYYMGPSFDYNMGLSNVKSVAQRFDENGSAQGAILTALTRTPSASAGTIVGADVKIAMDSDGDFAVVAATQYAKSKVVNVTQDGYTTPYTYYATSSNIAMRRFSSAGAAVGSEIAVASAALTPFFSASPPGVDAAQISNLAVSMDGTGNLIAMWDAAAYDADLLSIVSTGIFQRRYSAAGAAQESAPSAVSFGAGSDGAPGSLFPAVSCAPGGTFNLAWQAEDGSAVFTAQYRPVLPASKVTFTTQPESGAAGALSPISIEVQDANGFVVTDGSSVVKLAIFSGPAGATLAGTTSVTTVDGVATFSNLSLLRGGTYVLKATSGSLTSDNSESFQIITVPTQLAFTIQPRNGTAGTTMAAVTVSVRDANGDLVVNASSIISLAVATGPGILAGTTEVEAVNGVATFTDLSLPTAGTYTLLAASDGLTNASSSKFTMTAGAGAHFTFSTQPVDATAGAKMTVKVTVTDENGNLAVGDHSKLSLIIGDGPIGGTLTGTALATITNGMATFANISFPKAGGYVLSARHEGDEVATSDGFTISPGAASKLVFAHQPETTQAGDALDDVEVDVVDSFGNVVISNSSAVTLTVVTSPKGSAAPTGTFTQNAVDGAANFDDLVFTTAGGYALKATQGKFSITSAKFTILPDEVSKLVILTQPKNAVAGVAIKPAVTVSVQDQFGNVDTSNTSLITMTVDSGPGSLFGTATASALKGIAAFSNLVLRTAGTYTLAATQGSLDPGVTNSFLISPAAGATLQFVNQPVDVIAGQTMSAPATVRLLDAFGNLATGDKSTVTLKLASGPAGAKLFGKFSAAAVNGLATFGSLTLQTAGAYTLAATSGKMAGDTSSAFSVSSSVATKMQFANVPLSVATGSGFSLQVKILDAFGNVATGDGSNVTLSLGAKPTGGALGGSLTVAADHGIASFSGLTLTPKGKFTIRAANANPLAVITSGSINVIAVAPV
jgi:hypothetical protein